MVNFTSEHVSEHIIKISEAGVYCYLIKGADKACLVDTGWGIGDLKGYVETLTDLPYFVIISHGHVDHANGAGLFDEVYMNEADWELYKTESLLEKRKHDLKLFERGFPEIAEITEEDYNPVRTKPFLPLHDGDVFDLGEVHIEAVSVPGHTRGMTMLLVQEERIMFYGDGCTKHTFMFTNGALTIPEYLEGLKHLKEYDERYDTVIRSHNIYTQPKYILDENIELCKKIIAGTDAKQPVVVAGHHALSALPVDENNPMQTSETANIYYPA